MTTTAPAIYEHGVLRPLTPLPLADGTRVEVTVTDDVALSPGESKTRCANELLREVAALPMQSSGVNFTGRDHDRVLYGGPEL